MRPVEKWQVGHNYIYNGVNNIVQQTYNNPDYREAKPVLTANLSRMCSYCEKTYDEDRDLQVEHIQPKKFKNAAGVYIYAHLETQWVNFLLSCSTCNGQDNKDTKDVVYGTCHLPHLNNTFLSLCYDAGGVVSVNSSLRGISYDNANALLNLVGLNKTPQTSGKKDERWRIRSNNWNLANRFLTKYQNNETDIETIIELVKGRGGWSIWFTVFRGYDEVRKALIEQFEGTAVNCFDPNNHYDPVPRNPGSADPV